MENSTKALDELFNSRLYLHFHDDILSEERTERECGFIIDQLDLAKGAAVMDLACGHGRHANALASMELAVSAWDINGDFIKMARAAQLAQGLEVDYQCKDILLLDHKEVFDGIILLFNSLGFFSRAQAQGLIQRISTALKEGGKLFLDIKNRDHISKELVPVSIVERGPDMMIDRLSFDPKTGTTFNRRTYIKDGKRYEAPFSMTMFNYTDIHQMATTANLAIVKEFGHWDGRAFDQDSRRIILILEK